MKVRISRDWDDYYTMTAGRPVVRNIRGCTRKALYVLPGDPIGQRHLCPEMTERLIGRSLEPGQTVLVELAADVLGLPEDLIVREKVLV